MAAASGGVLSAPVQAGSLRDAMALEDSWIWSDKVYIQDLLQWSGNYRGRVDGDFGPGTRRAIEQFQRRNGHRVTGYLTPAEIGQLESEQRDWKVSMGYRIRDFPELGMTIGIPAGHFAEEPDADSTGVSFYADEGLLPMLTLYSLDRVPARDFRQIYDESMPSDEFVLDVYKAFRDDWFVFTGRSRDGIVQYTYMINGPHGVRGFSLLYAADEAEWFDRMPAIMLDSLQTYAGRRDAGAVSEIPKVEAPGRLGATAEPGPAALGASAGDPGARKGTAPSTSGGDATRPRAEAPRDDTPRVAREDPGRPPRARKGDGAERGGAGDRSRDRERDQPRLDGPVIASGSGFYVNTFGAILTNHHVIEGCRGLRINGELAAEALRSDRELDLALVQAEGGEDTPFLPFREGAARLNEDVTVIGYPLYGLLDRVNVTRGSISSLAGIEGDTRQIQITAPVQSGNSGGPVLDAVGRVVGVVQSKLDTLKLAEDMGEIAQNINFAIDARLAQKFLNGAGANFALGPDGAALSPPDLAEQAQLATVLIECIGQ